MARFWDDYHRRYAAFRNAYERRRRANRLAAPRPTPDRACAVCDGSLNGFRADEKDHWSLKGVKDLPGLL